jgi:hypothetical protein
MKRTLALAAAMALTVAACGDDGPTGPGGGGGNEMSATVGGVAFDPPSLAVQGTYTPAQGLVNIAGSHTSGGTTTLVTINVLNVNAAGTYQLNPNFAGSFGQVTTTNGQVNGTATWSTILSPGTGSITFSTLTADRAAGTFQFTGQASPGTAATGQKTVTSGTFDIEF